MAPLEPSPWIKGAPELVVEIGSPGTRKRDETVKKRLYERFGVDEYWVIDLELDTIEVYRRVDERYERTAAAHRGAAAHGDDDSVRPDHLAFGFNKNGGCSFVSNGNFIVAARHGPRPASARHTRWCSGTPTRSLSLFLIAAPSGLLCARTLWQSRRVVRP